MTLYDLVAHNIWTNRVWYCDLYTRTPASTNWPLCVINTR
jgi:hypothetical protein